MQDSCCGSMHHTIDSRSTFRVKMSPFIPILCLMSFGSCYNLRALLSSVVFIVVLLVFIGDMNTTVHNCCMSCS